MAEAERVQSQWLVMWFFAFLAAVFFRMDIGRAATTLSGPIGNDPSDPAIKRSASLVPLLWLSCAPFLVTKFGDVRSPGRWGRVGTKVIWMWACTLCLVHIAIAFHLGHGWSHEAAWEHTRQAGGYGDGIYVNYAFALVWVIDAIWLCVAYDSYFARPRWLHWTIHGFMAFVVFNAAVVFGGMGSRARFVGWAVLLTCAVLAAYYQRRIQANETQPDEASANPEASEITDIDAK